MRIASALPLVAVLALAACTPSEEQALKADLAAANRCETADDCVLIGGKCPFDCYIYAHKDEADSLRTRVDAYRSTCEYSCVASTGVDCVANKCVPRVEAPPPAEGNVGAACASDIECVTPMDYLVRSSCPFQSQCIEGTCAVTCPMIQEQPNPQTGLNEPVSCTEDAQCDCSSYAPGDMKDCRCTPSGCVAVVAK